MRGSLKLLLALCVQGSISIRVWESGKEYLFREEASIHVGTNDLNNTVTGFRFMSDVKVQVQDDKMVVTIDNIQEAHYAQSYPRNSWPYRLVNDKRELRDGEEERTFDEQLKSKYFKSIGYENGKTFVVHLEDGLAKSIELPKDLSINGKNMMKAIASMLQVDMRERTDEDMDYWKRRELSLHGECEFDYVFTKNQDTNTKYREITKTTTHLRQCKKRNFRVFDMAESRTCNIMDEDKMDDKMMFRPYGYDKFSRKEDTETGRFTSEQEHEHYYGEKVFREYFRPEPINSGSMTTFVMKEVQPEEYQLKMIFSRGMVIVNQYMTEDEDLMGERKGLTQMATANRTLYLKDVKGLGGLEAVQNPETLESLEFQWMDDKHKWDDVVALPDMKKAEATYYNGYKQIDETQDVIMDGLKTYIKNFVYEMLHYHDIDGNRVDVIEKLHKYNLGYLLPYFRSLNYDSLMTLKNYYLQLEKTVRPTRPILDHEKKYEDKMYERDIFLEVLPMTGSSASALAVMDIVKNNDLMDDLLNARLINSIPFHVDGFKSLIDEFYKLVTSNIDHLKWQFTRSALELSYASLVRKTCRLIPDLDQCYKDFKIEDFINKFDALSVNDHNLLNHYMLVFYNFRDSDVLEKKLFDVIYKKTDKKYDHDIRAMAIKALKYRAVRKGMEKDILLPILLNRGEHHEVRINAFDGIMQGFPDTTTMAKIMFYMIYETNYEVFNYVYTAYEKFALHNNEPCMKQVHEYAKYYLTFWKANIWMKPKYTLGLSKTWRNSLTKEKYGYANSMDVKIIGSHHATTPLSINIDLKTQRWNHMTTGILGLKLRMEGVAEKILERVKALFYEPRNINFEKLKKILFTDMNIRERKDVPAKLTFYLTFRDSVVFEFHLQDSQLLQRQENMTFDKLKRMFFQLKDLTAIYNLHRHFGFAANSYTYEQPTELGVPLVVQDEAFFMFNFNGKMKKDVNWMMENDINIKTNKIHYTKFSIFHPDMKHEYMIKKTVPCKTLIDTGLNLEVDWPARRVKLAMKVPREELPVSMLIHGRTIIRTHDNKLARTQIYLRKSCPTCLQTQVITNGREWRKGGVMVPKHFYDLSRVYGMELSGKYFDCELPESYSQGRFFWKFMKSFSPMNKEPKTLSTMFIGGLFQIHSFLYYYPRVESCGIRLKWGQSFDQPIDRILLDFDLRDLTRSMDRTMKFNEVLGDKRIKLAADLVFDGVYNRTHHLDLEMKYENEHAKTHIGFEMRRRPFTYQGRMYEDFPIIFRMDTMTEERRPWREITMRELTSFRPYKLLQNIELIYGKPDLKIRIDGEHKTTGDAKDFLRKKWYYNECLRQHKLPEWRDVDTLPRTDACYYAMVDLFTLRDYMWDIRATNLEEWMVTAYRKAGVLIKSALFPFWNFKPEYLKHEISPRQPTIRIETRYHPREDNFDLRMELDKEVSKFTGIKYGWWQWNEEPYMMLDKFRFLTNARLRPQVLTWMYANGITNNCWATRSSVRTYDNVTYDFHDGMDHGCPSLLSSDCSDHPTFAIFMKKDLEKSTERKDMPLELLTFIENEKIEIIPHERKMMSLGHHDNDKRDHTYSDVYTMFNQEMEVRQDFVVKINDKEYDLRVGDFLLFTKDEEPVVNKRIDHMKDYRFRIFRPSTFSRSIIIDYSPRVMILFDGNHVQTSTGPQNKGRHCGMCGDFNKNRDLELLNPKMCVVDSGDKMAKSWVLKTQCDKSFSEFKCERPLDQMDRY